MGLPCSPLNKFRDFVSGTANFCKFRSCRKFRKFRNVRNFRWAFPATLRINFIDFVSGMANFRKFHSFRKFIIFVTFDGPPLNPLNQCRWLC